MKNNENLILFVMGVGTLGVTFLLLFALSNRSPEIIPEVSRQVQVESVQASPVPFAPQPADYAPQQEVQQEAHRMGALDRQVAQTIEEATNYIAKGEYIEDEHIDLLKRLTFYSDISSTSADNRKAAKGLVTDLNKMLTLQDSVAKQVKLTGQISAVETDAHIHLANVAAGKRDTAEAQKIIERINVLYAIPGLSADQNKKLKNALSAIKNAYSAPAKPVVAEKPKPEPKPVVKAEPRPAAKPIVKATPKPAPKPVVKTEPAPAPVVKAAPAPAPVAAPAPVVAPVVTPAPAPVAKPAMKAASSPAKTDSSASTSQDVTMRYFKIASKVARYLEAKQYDATKHKAYIKELQDISSDADKLHATNRNALEKSLDELLRVEKMMGK